MDWQELAAIAAISSFGTAAIIKSFDWIFRARDSDQNLKKTLDLLSVNLEHNNQLLVKDITQIRDEILQIRQQQIRSTTRLGRRISNNETLIWRFINYFNSRVILVIETKEKLFGFEFVELPSSEED